MDVYSFNSYKEYLRQYINSHNRRGMISEIARAAGCQRPYIHQVLNGKPELTPDQAWGLKAVFGFNDDEAEYFFTLVLYSRSNTAPLRDSLKIKLEILRKKAVNNAAEKVA